MALPRHELDAGRIVRDLHIADRGKIYVLDANTRAVQRTLTLSTKIRRVQTANVLGKIPGRDPEKADERTENYITGRFG